MDHLAGIDVGATQIKLGTVDLEGRILQQDRLPAGAKASFVDFARPIAESLKRLQDKTGGTLRAVGIGTPGFTDKRTGVLMGGAENIPCLKGNSLSAFIKERFAVPAVTDNDGTCAAAGELAWGSARSYRDFLLITLGTGIGGGLVLDGKVYRGAQGFAGEVGHLGLDRNGPWCVCGSRGCFEQYASATAIVRLHRERLQKRRLPIPEPLEPAAVLMAARNGDPVALETVRHAARAIAQAFGSVANLLNVEACIIGGGLSAMADQLAGFVREYVADYAWPLLASGLKIHTAALRNDAGLLGAAALALQELSWR
jgi:glucokinase